MAGEKPKSREKQERLAKALKANLARRKSQQRSRADAPDPAPEEEDGCPN